jgi:hypothetical protein
VLKRQGGHADRKVAFTVLDEPVRQKNTPEQSGEDLVITDVEKNYFEGLFPAAAKDIRSYSPYQRNGGRNAASLGTLIDLKG